MQKDLYCGRTCTDWFKICSCVLIYYLFLFGFWLLCFTLFQAAILSPAEPLPYRKGYIFANEKIEENLYPVAYNLSKTVKKELMRKERLSLITMSHLDFPLLSLLPHRFDGGPNDAYTDDDAPGDIRNARYTIQAKNYWAKLLRHNSGKLWHDEKVVGEDSGMNVENCGPDSFFNDRLKNGLQGFLLMNTGCKIDDDTFNSIRQACDAVTDTSDIAEMDWSYNITQPEGEKELSVSNFKPCLLVKLNNIVGVVPIPWKGEELKQMYTITMKGNGTKVYSFPSLETLMNETQDGQHKLPLACWLNIQPTAKESKDHAEDLGYFFNNSMSEDFLTFYPGPYIDLRQFPYMANHAHPNIPTVIRVNYNDNIKPKDVVSLDCRVFAKNIPYKYLLDTTPANKFGHVRVRMKYYEDKHAAGGSTLFWKLEK